MMQYLLYVATFFLALLFSLYLTPVFRKAAIKFNIVDRPDGRLKNHAEPTPYLGGLSIYVSFLLALSLTFDFSKEVLGTLLAGSIILILGLIDDFGVLGPWAKLAGQSLAAVVLIKSSIFIKLTFIPFWLAIPLTFLWLIAITNAFNLVDIMDGLSAGIAFISTVFLFAVAWMNERVMIAMLLSALAGSILGFLKYNFHPARIYMGDAGSLFIGLTIGSLAMINSYTINNRVASIVPIIILGVPIFDMLFVMYVRWRRGLPIMTGSPDHFALRLRKWRLSTRGTVVLSYLIAAFFGLMGILIVLSGYFWAYVFLGIILLSALVSAIWLKKIDMSL
ncbi:MAG: MraY family glycosyltransferase [Acidobacteriota bacterium]